MVNFSSEDSFVLFFLFYFSSSVHICLWDIPSILYQSFFHLLLFQTSYPLFLSLFPGLLNTYVSSLIFPLANSVPPLLPMFVVRHPLLSFSFSLPHHLSFAVSFNPPWPFTSFFPFLKTILPGQIPDSSSGIRGPPVGEGLAVTMEVAPVAYHHPVIYFGS